MRIKYYIELIYFNFKLITPPCDARMCNKSRGNSALSIRITRRTRRTTLAISM